MKGMENWLDATKGFPLVISGPNEQLYINEGVGSNGIGNLLAWNCDNVEQRIVYRPVTPPPPEAELAVEEEDDVASKGASELSAPVKAFASDYTPACLADVTKATTTDERKTAYFWILEAVRQEYGPPASRGDWSIRRLGEICRQSGRL